MAKKFDAMHEWLGIEPADQPPCHYRLLGIERFESSPGLIEEAVKKRKLLLQKHAQGEYIEDAKQLYEEIKKAKRILLSDERRAIYDRLLAKGSRKKFVAPSRSARNHKLDERETTVTSHRPQNPTSTNSVMSTGMVLASLGAMFTLTLIGVGLIIAYGQRTVTAAIVQNSNADSNANAEETKLPNSVEPNENSQAKKAPSNLVSRPENTSSGGSHKLTNSTNLSVRSPTGDDSTQSQTKTNEVNTARPEQTESSPRSAEGMPPNAIAEWEKLIELQGVLQGQVQLARESNTGKTRYLYFSSDRNDVMVFLRSSKVGDKLSLDYLKSLMGKNVRVRGKVQREFGTNRLGLVIEDESQIEIVE